VLDENIEGYLLYLLDRNSLMGDILLGLCGMTPFFAFKLRVVSRLLIKIKNNQTVNSITFNH
jgi:hypothetical protein